MSAALVDAAADPTTASAALFHARADPAKGRGISAQTPAS